MVLLVVAGGLLVLGVLSFVLQPGPPEAVCAAADAPSSGFVDSDRNCAITIESYDRIRKYETSPKPFRVAGAGLVLVGLMVGVTGLVKRSRPR
jgi:hypothetical protein